jgi:hypothetical protein
MERSMERTQWDNGIHKLEFEPPDVFHCHMNGPVALEEAKLTVKIQQELAAEVGNLYLIMYLHTGLQGFSPEVRKYFGTLKPVWKASLVVGGNAIARAAVNLGMRAMNVLSGSPIPFRMFKTAEEAHAFISELRSAEATAAKQ